MAIWDYLRKSGRLWKTAVVLGGLVAFAIISMVLVDMGLAIIFVILAAVIALGVVAFLAYKAYSRFQTVDVLKAVKVKLSRGARLGSLPYEVPLVVRRDENSTVWSFQGLVQGRTMLPIDLTLLEFMGEPETYKRTQPNADNEMMEFDEDNIVWCFRVKQPNGREELYIICDSQISDLSRDVTGDIQIGTAIQAYGHLIQVGQFFVLWNTGKQLERQLTALNTLGMEEVFERHLNRMATLARMDVKSREEILEKMEVRKDEADVNKE